MLTGWLGRHATHDVFVNHLNQGSTVATSLTREVGLFLTRVVKLAAGQRVAQEHLTSFHGGLCTCAGKDQKHVNGTLCHNGFLVILVCVCVCVCGGARVCARVRVYPVFLRGFSVSLSSSFSETGATMVNYGVKH